MKSSRWIALMLCAMVGLFSLSQTFAFAQDEDAANGTAEVAPAADSENDDPAQAPVDPAAADDAATDDHEEAAAESVSELNTGDNAWMLTSTALVLFMTVPGLAMFYGGLVRRKNILSVLMQCIFLMGMMTVLWALVGYSLCFGGDNPWFGNLDHALMNGLTMVDGDAPGGNIPDLTFMVFQGMFFIITPALICGAVAERMKFSAMAVFMALWGLLVYCPLCHWVWDSGILAYHGDQWKVLGGALDFAGGTVVHISSGISALVCALVIGKRLGFRRDDMRPHNLAFTVIGAGMLWVGWFGFNAGSALEANALAANALVVTHFSAAAGVVAWSIAEKLHSGKCSVLGAASGGVAGLVCITPAAGFVQPMPALIMGALGGLVCFWACVSLKQKLGYDDSLDAFGVHGVGGTLGAVLTGVFASKHVGGVDPSVGLVVGQIAAVVVTAVLSIVVSFILLKIIDATIGLRVSQEEETIGLDQSQHGEEGYIF